MSAHQKLTVALATANQLSQLAEIAHNPAKKNEVDGVTQNLRSAQAALATGRDPDGDPITPSGIGGGLQRMNDYMQQHAIWFRLHANASDQCQQLLNSFQSQILAASDACCQE